MSGTIILGPAQLAAGQSTVVAASVAAAVNAVRRVVVPNSLLNAPVTHPAVSTDLGEEFACWSDGSLDWAQTTFDAQIESWPAQ